MGDVPAVPPCNIGTADQKRADQPIDYIKSPGGLLPTKTCFAEGPSGDKDLRVAELAVREDCAAADREPLAAGLRPALQAARIIWFPIVM